MSLMQKEILAKMEKSLRTTKNYVDGYMSTIEQGTLNSNNYIDTAAMQLTIEDSNKYFETIHSAQNPIYSKEEKLDNFERKVGKKKFDRAKAKANAKEIIDESLSEDELDTLLA